MQKLRAITRKTIIIFVVSVILISSIIPTSINNNSFAAYEEWQEKVNQYNEMLNKTSSELKNKVNESREYYQEYVAMLEAAGQDISDVDKIANDYLNNYYPFRKEKKYDELAQNTTRFVKENGKIVVSKQYRDYLAKIADDYNKSQGNSNNQQTNGENPENQQGNNQGDQENQAETPNNNQEEIKVNTSEEEDDIDKEEKNKVYELLKREDTNGSYIVGPAFEVICKLAIAIADSVMNILQSNMLPGSPTAIKQRYKDIKDILEARGNPDLYYIYFFVIDYDSTKNVEATAGGVQLKDTLPEILVKERIASTEPVPFIYYSPISIFSNKIPAFDVNFINESQQLKNPFIINSQNQVDQGNIDAQKDFLVKTEYVTEDKNEQKTKEEKEKNEDVKKAQDSLKNAVKDARESNTANSAKTLQKTISIWYIVLRDITAVGLLIVLVYIGIRILISSTGEEQARYKSMLVDWVVSLVLVLFIHFIMSILLTITNALTGIVSQTVNFLDKTKGGDELFNDLRSQVSLYAKKEDLVMMAGYGMLYITTVWYTVRFTWRFLKRVIFMAFLTVMSPLVALTYSIDRIRDGKSQAFDLWLKEYTFNLIIQPIDLLVYTVIFTSATQLIESNPLYGVVAIGFVAQAENIIKKMFGLEPRQSSGAGAFASGAVFGSIMSGLKAGASGITNTLTGEETEEISEENDDGKIRMVDDGRSADKDASKNLSKFKENAKLNLNTPGKTNSGNGAPGAPGTPGTPGNTTGSSIYGNNQEKPKIKNRPIGLGGRIGTSPMARGIGRVRGRYLNLNTAKKAGKLATAGLGAGVFGTIGVGAGLASDNYANVFKMGGLGAAGGAVLGNEIAKQAGAIVEEGKEIRDAYQKGYYGDEYEEEVLNPRLDRKWYHSEQTKRALINKYGSNWKEKREEALQLRKQGITKQEDIEKAIKLKDDKGFSIEEAGNIVNFVNKVTSRKELLQEGGEENLYNQVLNLVGDEEQAKRAMQGIKETLNLPGNGENTTIREQKINTEITPEEMERTVKKDSKPPKTYTDEYLGDTYDDVFSDRNEEDNDDYSNPIYDNIFNFDDDEKDNENEDQNNDQNSNDDNN